MDRHLTPVDIWYIAYMHVKSEFCFPKDNIKHMRAQENDETYFLWAMR